MERTLQQTAAAGALSVLLVLAASDVFAGEVRRGSSPTRAARTAPLADLPPCGNVLDLLSEAELAALRARGLESEEIAAVAILAHHGKQSPEQVAARLARGESLARMALAARLSPAALRRAARKAARDVPAETGSPGAGKDRI